MKWHNRAESTLQNWPEGPRIDPTWKRWRRWARPCNSCLWCTDS